MKILLFFMIFLLFINVNGDGDNRVRVWERIPEYKVENAIYNFLNTHDINNCYKFQENEYTLLLKCWRQNKLIQANFQIGNYNGKHILYIDEYESVYV
jgi:hypothetical protein